jgi:hypothetical protein
MLSLAIANVATAQGNIVFGPGAEFIGVGVSRLETKALDDRLAASGYPTFGQTPRGVNLGGYRILWGAWTLGAEWHGIVFDGTTHDGREVGQGGGYGTVGVGRVVELSPRIRVYPRLGLGGGGMGLWIEDPEVPPVAFDDVLRDPARYRDPLGSRARTTVISYASAVMDFGAGAELLSRLSGRGPMIGLRVGYLAVPSSTRNWQLYDRRISDGPAASIAGPYIRLLLGTGRRK